MEFQLYHIRALCHARGLLTDDVAQTPACSIIGSRLDYCNALVCGGAPWGDLQRTPACPDAEQSSQGRQAANVEDAPTMARCSDRSSRFQ